MFGLEALDVLIGLVTVYLAFGVACTAVVEAISAWFNVRSSTLEAAMKEFLAGNCNEDVPEEEGQTRKKKFDEAFYEHPLVQALTKKSDGRPSYIPPQIVGQVVEAVVIANGTATSLAAAVKSLPDGRIKSLLDIFVTQAGGDAAKFRTAVEDHFNAAMERASGCFKRFAQNVALCVSVMLVLLGNVDTISIANSLAADPAARTRMVEVAQQHLTAAQNAETSVDPGQNSGGITIGQATQEVKTARAALDRALSHMDSEGLQLGWRDWPKTLGEWFTKVAGLLVSIFAVSLGAPFWFDLLQRFMQVRATGIAPGEPARR